MFYEAEINILCWNQLDLTKQCIDSIFENTDNFKLNIWDNGSDDGTREYLISLNSRFKNVEIFLHDKNEGFIIPNNRMAERLQSPYLVLLNNDTIVSKGWLPKLLLPLKQSPDVAQTGCKGAILNSQGYGVNVRDGMAFDYLEGWCIALPYRIVKEFGLFDEKNLYFAYSEDSDLSLRLREAGYKIKCVNCGVKHIGSATRKKSNLDFEGIQLKNHFYLIQRWGDYLKKRSFHKKILVKRSGAFGDVLLATSVVSALKNKYPNSTIDFDTKCGLILVNNPYIHSIVQNSKEEDYDIYIDLDMSYENNPNMHILKAYSKTSGIDCTRFNPVFFYNKNDESFVNKILKNQKYVVFHTGKTWENRSWPIERFREVAKFIMDTYKYRVVEVGDLNTESIQLPGVIDLRGKTTFSTLGALLHNALFFIGIDSVVSHIAQSLWCSSIILFGCVNPDYRKHPNTHTKCIWKSLEEVPCRGCHHLGVTPKTSSTCPRSTIVCMDKITVGDVINEVKIMNTEIYFSETAKCRKRVINYCQGRGLDIGCGKDKIKPDAIGVDKRIFKGVDITCNAIKLPFPDESMNYVFSSHCLEDIEDTELALREWTRVIRPGGYLILYLPDKNLYKGFNADHKHEFVPSDIITILQKIGDFDFIDTNTYSNEHEYSFQIIVRKK